MRNLITFFSYVIWSFVTFVCLKRYSSKYYYDLTRFAYITFLITAMNSTLGFTEIYQEDVMSSLRVLLEILQATLALPCLTTEVWLRNQISQKEVAWLHTGIGLIPTYVFLFQHYTRQDLIDFTVITNILSLAGVGLFYKEIFSFLSALSIFLAFCVFHQRNQLFEDELSKQLFNYGMTVFIFCGYKAVVKTPRHIIALSRSRSSYVATG